MVDFHSKTAQQSEHDAESHDATKQRLLNAAGEEFARVGFRLASIRSICEAAHANISAVKYHFGSKDDLYKAVWEVAARDMVQAEDCLPKFDPSSDPKPQLRAFMAWFMRLVLVERAERSWTGNLVAHETVDVNDAALEIFVSRCAGPMRRELHAIITAIAGDRTPPEVTDDLTNGVIALCVNQKHSAEILTRLGFPPPTDPESVNRLAHVLADFALHGLDGFAHGD